MIAIWKYEIPIVDSFSLPLKRNSNVMCVQTQSGFPCIWVLCDTEEEINPKHFRVVGTGNPINNTLGKYIGTFQTFEGQLVWHLFETWGREGG